jgi:hypothetical protein
MLAFQLLIVHSREAARRVLDWSVRGVHKQLESVPRLALK